MIYAVKVKYLISQNSERPLQSTGRSILGCSGKPLCVVADLSLQRVDVGDNLFGSDNVLGYVDDGLRTGEGTAAESKDALFQQRVCIRLYADDTLISSKCKKLEPPAKG